MNRRTARRADKRIPIALGLLGAVLTLLGGFQIALPGASPAVGQPIQIASVSSPAR